MESQSIVGQEDQVLTAPNFLSSLAKQIQSHECLTSNGVASHIPPLDELWPGTDFLTHHSNVTVTTYVTG